MTINRLLPWLLLLGSLSCIEYREGVANVREQKFLKAAKEGDLVTIKRLLGAGVDIETEIMGRTALVWAARNNHINIVEFLLQDGADVANGGITNDIPPLHFAVRFFNYKIVELLLKNGANPNHVTGYHQICLTSPIHNDYYDIAKILLEYGANPLLKVKKSRFAWESKDKFKSSAWELVQDEKFQKYKNLIKKAIKEERWLQLPLQDPKPL